MSIAEFGIIAAAIAALAGTIGYLVKARTDWLTGNAAEQDTERKDVEQLLSLKDEMIAALREANEDLRAREARLASDIDDLRGRLQVVERDYRTLLQQAVELGICARAPGCLNYVPPGGRGSETVAG